MSYRYQVIPPDMVIILNKDSIIAYKYNKVKRYMPEREVLDPLNWSTVKPETIINQIKKDSLSDSVLIGNELWYAMKMYEKYLEEERT